MTIILMPLPQCADRTAIIIYTYQNIDTDGEGGIPLEKDRRGVGGWGSGFGDWGLEAIGSN